MNNILSGLSEDWKALVDAIEGISEPSLVLDVKASDTKETYLETDLSRLGASPWIYVKPYSERAAALYEQLNNRERAGFIATTNVYEVLTDYYEFDVKNHILYIIAPKCTVLLYKVVVHGPNEQVEVSPFNVQFIDGVFKVDLDSDLGASSKDDLQLEITYGKTLAINSGAELPELPLPYNTAYDKYYFMCTQYSCVFTYVGGTMKIGISGNDSVSVQEVSNSNITATLSSSTLPATLEITVSKDIELSGLEFVKLHGNLSKTDKVISVNKLSQSWDIPLVNNTPCKEDSSITVNANGYGTDKDQYLEVWVKAKDGVLVEVELTNKKTGELTYLFGSENASKGETIRHNFGRVFDTDAYEVEITFTVGDRVHSYWANVNVTRSNAAEVNYIYLQHIEAEDFPHIQETKLGSFIVNCSPNTRWMIIGETIQDNDQGVVYSDTSGQEVEQVKVTEVPSLYFNVEDPDQISSFVDYTGSEEAVKKGMIPYIGAFPFPQSYHSYSPNFDEYSVGVKTTNEQRIQVVNESLGVTLSNTFVYPYILSGLGPFNLKGESNVRSWINSIVQSNGTNYGILQRVPLVPKRLIVASWNESGSNISNGVITTVFNVGTGLPQIPIRRNLCGLHFFKLDGHIYLDGYESSKTYHEWYAWQESIPNGSKVVLNEGIITGRGYNAGS